MEEFVNEQEELEEQEGSVDETETEEQEEYGISDEDIIAALENPSDAVKEKLNSLIQKAVKKALAKSTPKKGVVKCDPLTKEKFAKMSYAEREKLFNSNRPLYEKLKNY